MWWRQYPIIADTIETRWPIIADIADFVADIDTDILNLGWKFLLSYFLILHVIKV